MFRPLSFFIGLRYTRAKRRNHFISFISLTSMIGLALGVMAMIVVLSVMNGFQKVMSSRILGLVPHITLTAEQPAADWRVLAEKTLADPRVLAAAPFAELDGMFSYRGLMQPIQIHGVDPTEEYRVSNVPSNIVRGSVAALEPDAFGVILGAITARRLGIQLGDRLTLIVPELSDAPGGIAPRMQRLRVVGVSRAGTDLDDSIAWLHVADVGTLLRQEPGVIPSIRLKLRDFYQAPEVSADLAKRLGDGVRTDDWTRTQGSLFSAMKMEKTMIGLLLLLIIAVAAFNIVATLIMVVSDKGSDIAILRTLGATPRQIMAIFMVQGSVIGLAGTIIGAVLGLLLAFNISELVTWLEARLDQQMFTADIYFINSLPSDPQAMDVLLICCVALLLSFLATLYPSWRAAQIQPAEALRYE